MLRRATLEDVLRIQSVLNAPGNLSKLEGYGDQVLRDAIRDPDTLVFVWEDHAGWQGFCWCNRTEQGVKIEEFGVIRTGQGVGRLFFLAVLNALQDCDTGAQIWLAVAADNAGAIRFYESFGFLRAQVKKAAWVRRQGPIADALIMRLKAFRD